MTQHVNFKHSSIEIINFSEALSEPIKTLNYEWLERYFRIEPSDVVTLSDPKKYIIDKGGYIFYARMGKEIVGTVSLLKVTDQLYELGKMAVTEKAQGKGIGALLVDKCIQVAQEKRIAKIFLYSNTILPSALHLYQKKGFKIVEMDSPDYERANIKLEQTFY